MRNVTILLAVAAVALLLTGSNAQAANIAYDGFNYTAGENLIGQNGGTGN